MLSETIVNCHANKDSLEVKNLQTGTLFSVMHKKEHKLQVFAKKYDINREH